MNYKTFDIHQYIKQKPREKEANLFPEEFSGLLVGGPGSGKTTLLGIMLKDENALYKKFDLTLFISPYPLEGLNIKSDRLRTTIDFDWIVERINYFKEEKQVRNCLIIMDDVAALIKQLGNSQELIDFMFNRRKIVEGTVISLLQTVQKFTVYPAKFRSCLNMLFVFKVPPEDFKLICKEQVYHPMQVLLPIAKAHYQKHRNNFIYILLSPYKLFLNFEKEI